MNGINTRASEANARASKADTRAITIISHFLNSSQLSTELHSGIVIH